MFRPDSRDQGHLVLRYYVFLYKLRFWNRLPLYLPLQELYRIWAELLRKQSYFWLIYICESEKHLCLLCIPGNMQKVQVKLYSTLITISSFRNRSLPNISRNCLHIVTGLVVYLLLIMRLMLFAFGACISSET